MTGISYNIDLHAFFVLFFIFPQPSLYFLAIMYTWGMVVMRVMGQYSGPSQDAFLNGRYITKEKSSCRLKISSQFPCDQATLIQPKERAHHQPSV